VITLICHCTGLTHDIAICHVKFSFWVDERALVQRSPLASVKRMKEVDHGKKGLRRKDQVRFETRELEVDQGDMD